MNKKIEAPPLDKFLNTPLNCGIGIKVHLEIDLPVLVYMVNHPCPYLFHWKVYPAKCSQYKLYSAESTWLYWDIFVFFEQLFLQVDYKSYLLDFKSLVEEDPRDLTADRRSPVQAVELSSSLDQNRTLKTAQVG